MSEKNIERMKEKEVYSPKQRDQDKVVKETKKELNDLKKTIKR